MSPPLNDPSENNDAIHEASLRVMAPIGEASDSSIGTDGDTQPTVQP